MYQWPNVKWGNVGDPFQITSNYNADTIYFKSKLLSRDQKWMQNGRSSIKIIIQINVLARDQITQRMKEFEIHSI
jgi:hypothetical protein